MEEQRDQRDTDTGAFDLRAHEIAAAEVYRNLPPSSLYEHGIRFDKDASIAENGALVAYSGAKTGRSPKDKRVVQHPASERDIWWGAWKMSGSFSGVRLTALA